MRAILLSTSLVLVLAFSGCDDNDTKDSAGGFVEQSVDLNITEGRTSVGKLSASNATELSYQITGGNEKAFFELDGNELLFKTGQDYLAGGDNSYDVDITVTDNVDASRGRLLRITVDVKRKIVINTDDTTAPVFVTGTTLSMTAGTSVTISATDASGPITYALTSGAGFVLSGSTLTAPATAGGPTNITISATDSAATPNTASQVIAVTVSVPVVDDSVTTVSVGPFDWTVVKVDEDGRISRALAEAACPVGMKLPTAQQLEDRNTTDLVAKLGITGTIHIPLWIDDNATSGYALVQTPIDGYTFNLDADTLTNYFTCVKPN